MILLSFKGLCKFIWKYMCKVPLDVYIVIVVIIGITIAILTLNNFYKQIQHIVINFIGADKQRIQLFTQTLMNDYKESNNVQSNTSNEADKIDYDDLKKLE